MIENAVLSPGPEVPDTRAARAWWVRWRTLVLCVVAAASAATGVAVAVFGTSSPRPGVAAYGWGAATAGQLGPGVTGIVAAPVPLSLPADVSAVTAGRSSSVALAGGRVYTWGSGVAGELGTGSLRNTSEPARVQLPAVRSVAASGQHVLAVARSGAVFSWGGNAAGQLGVGDRRDRAHPVRVALPRDVVAVATGATHSLAVTVDGSVWAWGQGVNGELGGGRAASSVAPVRVHLPHGVRVSSVAAGLSSSLALTTRGGVLAWGSNAFGQLGLGAVRQALVPSPVPLAHGVRAVQVVAAVEHSAVVTADGRMLAWGANAYGQVGDGTTASRRSPVAVALPGGLRVASAAAGGRHMIALARGGTAVLSWGAGDAGQVGTGRRTDVLRPVVVTPPQAAPVTLARVYRSVAAGYYVDFALAERGPAQTLVATPVMQGLPAGHAYTFAVAAFDAAGNEVPLTGARAELPGARCSGTTCTPLTLGRHRVTFTAAGLRTSLDVVVYGGLVALLPARSSDPAPSASASATPSR